MTDTAPAYDRFDDSRTLPAVVYGLYMLGLMNGLTVFVGLIIAYANKDGAGPRMHSHYIFQIRTFWTAVGWWAIGLTLLFWGALLSIILVGIPFVMLGGLIFAVGHIWFALRCILGVLYLARGEAYPRPRTWLV
jgi:uncharacterized membrane protein